MYNQGYTEDKSPFTYPILLAITFICFSMIILVINLNQITNIKETVDAEFKKSISSAIIVHINDQYSSDRVATLKDTDKNQLKVLIRQLMTRELEQRYNISLTIKDIDITLDDRIYVSYKGIVKYKAIGSYGFEFEIPVKGRSKAQRFDV